MSMITLDKQWVALVRRELRTRGYYYQRNFCDDAPGAERLIAAAKLMGSVYVPSGTEASHPFIPTQPSAVAPLWRPFDRGEAIGWHNDFSTHSGRPELSMSWILREDPAGPENGAWCVASSRAVLTKLSQTCEGKRLAADLKERAEPFGYRDAGSWRSFRVIIPANRRLRQSALRFYGLALKDGAWLRSGKVAERTNEIIFRIEDAADSVREVLPAVTGSLLIVHNGLSLHDRSAQTVTGSERNRRRALLCFVNQLHYPL